MEKFEDTIREKMVDEEIAQRFLEAVQNAATGVVLTSIIPMVTRSDKETTLRVYRNFVEDAADYCEEFEEYVDKVGRRNVLINDNMRVDVVLKASRDDGIYMEGSPAIQITVDIRPRRR